MAPRNQQHSAPLEAAEQAVGSKVTSHNYGGGLADDTRTAPPGVAASGDEAALRLEKRTHLDGGDYRITLRNYGNGLAEIGWAFAPTIPISRVGKGLSDHREANEDRAVRRARSNLRRKILSAGADHLLTLTYRENITDFEQAGDDLSRFVRLIKVRLPAWAYVAVAEQQKRGAWHWHLAVCGRQDVAFLRTCWRQVVGEGNIDVNPPKANGQHRQLALVKYLGKYLAKSFETGQRELNGRRFRSSLGISVPCQMIPLPPEYRHDVAGYAAGQLKLAAGAVGHIWESNELPAGWACSWS